MFPTRTLADALSISFYLRYVTLAALLGNWEHFEHSLFPRLLTELTTDGFRSAKPWARWLLTGESTLQPLASLISNKNAHITPLQFLGPLIIMGAPNYPGAKPESGVHCLIETKVTWPTLNNSWIQFQKYVITAKTTFGLPYTIIFFGQVVTTLWLLFAISVHNYVFMVRNKSIFFII